MSSMLFRNFNFQKKYFATLLFLFAVNINIHSQNTNLLRAKQLGGSNQDAGNAITTDPVGNVYTTGYFTGTADFDPGPGTFNLTTNGGSDIFVSKLDPSGNFLWAKQMAGIFPGEGTGIAVDASGNVYTTGYFNGTTDFDPGPVIYNLISDGVNDIFVSKLDPSGNFLWAKRLGGTSDDKGSSIAVAGNGDVYSTGGFQGTADFDPGPGIYNLVASGINASDIYVSKLDFSGNFVWAKQLGGASDDFGTSIAIDANTNVYTTGYFYGVADFDPGAGAYNLSSLVSYDIFVSKLNSSGNFILAKQLGGVGDDRANSIVVDLSGNIYTTGYFNGSADFDPGPSSFNITSVGVADVFISKLDNSGNFLWAKQIGGVDAEIGQAITIDANNNVYTTGRFLGTADFDPGSGIYNLTCLNFSDVFVCKLDAIGNFLLAKQMGGGSDDRGNAIKVDAYGNVFTTGYFNGTADFDPGTQIFNLTSFGLRDAFVIKLGELPQIPFNPNFQWAKQLGGANNEQGRSSAIDVNGNIYTTGKYNGPADFDPGSGTFYLNGAGCFISKLDASGNFVWAKKIGENGTEGFSIATDANGNVYTTGLFKNLVDFDPGPAIFNLNGNNFGDIFVSKLDADGNFLWAKQLGNSAEADAGYSIAVDAAGNVYTTGSFRSPADFDPGPGTYNLNSSGIFDEVFVSKLDASGNFVWAKGFGGLDSDFGFGITVDAIGNVYSTGRFSFTVDFDPGPGIYNITAAGNTDAFISKLDASGNFVWAKNLGGANNDWATSIKVSQSGNVYTTGYFGSIADFDPGAGNFNLTSTGGDDIFISKLSPVGNFIWAKNMGGTGNDFSSSIALDANENIYTTGHFVGVSDFNPGTAANYLTASGSNDGFVSKLDVGGNFVWAQQFGGSGAAVEGHSIIAGANGLLYISGIFLGTVDFNTGPQSYNLTSTPLYDVFVVRLADPLTIIAPQIFLDKALIQYGQTNIVWGKNFTPNGQIKINISSQSPNTSLADTIINANSQGYFNFTYHFVSSLLPGVYTIRATDLTTQHSSYLVRLVVVSISPIVTRDLKITSPIINTSSKVNKSLKIAWSDKPSHISTLIQNTSQVNSSYKIEYNKDNSGWQLITIKTYKANYRELSNFLYNYTPSLNGVYQFRVTDNLDVLNTNTSATINVNDPITGAELEYAWDYSGNRPNGMNDNPIGVASDGTSRIYIKVLKKAGNNKTISNVTLTVKDPAFPAITESSLLGKLMVATDITAYSLQANIATLTSVNSLTSGPGNIFWFWYVSPNDFVRNDDDTILSKRELNLEAVITYSDNTTDNVTEKVEIVRPPLMFVHGIGGNEGTWDDFYYSLNGTPRYFTRESDSRWKLKRALNMYPGGSYIQNAQLLLTLTNSGFKLNSDITESYNSNSFQFFLKQMRVKGYSCNRVDYIAHSMGGDMARTAINYYPLEYKPNVSIQRKFKNYGNGFINKLITLNTPHNGSPVADLTIEKLSQNWIVKFLLQASYNSGYGLDGYLIRSAFNTIVGTDKLDFNNPTEALKNLRYGSNGVKFLTSNVKNHLIAGDLLIGGEDCLAAYNIIKNDQTLGLVYKLFGAIGGTSCIAIDEIFATYGVNDFIENSDFVVPLASELPGKNITGSGNDYSIYYGIKPSHLSVHNSSNNPSVGQNVFSLLNAPINSIRFAETIAANSNSGPNTYLIPNQTNFTEWIDTSKIVIINPFRLTNYSVDSTISITVKLKDTLNFKYLNVLFQSEIYFSNSKASTQNFNAQINPVFVDSQLIVTTAVYDSLGYDIEYTDTLSINIIKDTVINGFYVTPKTKYLNSGQTYIPTYNLIHNSYITNVSILDSALHIAIADTNVVTYSNTQKNFIAKDTGTTYGIISYKQFKDTLFIIIDTTSLNSGPPLPVTLLSFNGYAKSTYNLLEWKTTSEVNFSHFNLQRSLDGSSWTQIARINSHSNSGTGTTKYDFKDSLISNTLTFYRLILVDIDGNFKTSNTELIRRGNDNSTIRVFPNPVTKSEVFIDFGSSNNSLIPIFNLVDLSGKTLNIKITSLQSNIIRLDLYGLKPSTYFLKIQKGSDFQTIKLVVIE